MAVHTRLNEWSSRAGAFTTDPRQIASFAVHDALPAPCLVGPITFDPGRGQFSVTARAIERTPTASQGDSRGSTHGLGIDMCKRFHEDGRTSSASRGNGRRPGRWRVPHPVTVGTVHPEEPVVVARGASEQFRRRFRRDRVGMAVGAFLVLLVVAATVGAPLAAWLTGHDYALQLRGGLDLNGTPLPPLSHELLDNGQQDPNGQFFLLGTDRLGRDVLVRLLYGARISLIVAFTATSVALVVGVPLGLAAGYYGGILDRVVSRAIETAMAFPALLFAVGLAAVIGPGLLNVIVVIALFSWYYPARLVRAAVLSLKHQQFVEAAISVGADDRRIMLRHLLPQLTAPIIVYATGIIALNILFEAGLSFLGLGVPPPEPSWGQLLADGVANGLYRVVPWVAVIPGVALVLTTLAFNLLGDALRDAFAPRGGA